MICDGESRLSDLYNLVFPSDVRHLEVGIHGFHKRTGQEVEAGKLLLLRRPSGFREDRQTVQGAHFQNSTGRTIAGWVRLGKEHMARCPDRHPLHLGGWS